MPDESVDKFLEEILFAEKPLSEAEKKEAMGVARKVWVEAMKKTKKGENVTSLKAEASDGEEDIALYTNEKIRMIEPEDPRTDLVINVRHRDNKGDLSPISYQYEFSPDKVVRKRFDLSAQGVINANDFAEIRDPVVSAKILQRARAQQLEEMSQPNSAHLSNLLTLVSTAQPVVSSVR